MIARTSTCLFVLFALGCGGAASSSTPTTATVGDETPAEETTVAADAPCTSWDPAADPTIAPADVAAPPEGARRAPGDLRFCILREGTGAARPSREDRVTVHYTGWTTDGVMFDSSHTRGEPATFPVNGVIRGWIDSLTHMTVGQVRRVWIPEELAYQGRAGMPAGMLVFDIELIAIE